MAATEAESESAARDWAGRSSAVSDYPGAPIRFDVVSYDFLQLRTWKAAARELLGESDVVYIDADEVRNRLVLGVTPGAVTSQIRERTRELDIPDTGVEFVTASRIGFEHGDGAESPAAPAAAGSATLRDEVRPTMGGLQIKNPQQPSCTLGFNAVLDGGPAEELYFATASHCSLSIFSNPDSGVVAQDPSGPRVGREWYDIEPHESIVWFDGQPYDCTSDPCRFSDASLILYDDTIDAGDVDLGRIARTTGSSITIDGRSDIVVKRDHSTLYSGLKVRKVGQKTGTSGGSITETCYDYYDDQVDIDFLCMYFADYYSDGGDSGSPVYVRYWDGTVALIGIHSGDPPQLGKMFSTLAGIEEDLSVTLDVCIPTGCAPPPPPLDVEIEGPTEVLEFAQCTYTADATGAYPPYSYQWYIDEEPVEEEGDQEELVIEDVGTDDFWLEVRVTDSKSFNEFEEIFVDVSPNHPNCPLSP